MGCEGGTGFSDCFKRIGQARVPPVGAGDGGGVLATHARASAHGLWKHEGVTEATFRSRRLAIHIIVTIC